MTVETNLGWRVARRFTDALIALAKHPVATLPGEAFEVVGDEQYITFSYTVQLRLTDEHWHVTCAAYTIVPRDSFVTDDIWAALDAVEEVVFECAKIERGMKDGGR